MGGLYQDHQATQPAPLVELVDTYSQCLDLSRDYAARTITDDPEREVDLEALEHFLSARADLFALAEAHLHELTGTAADPAVQQPSRKELTSKVVAILEEMAEMETQLTTFLNDRLSQMRRTIGQMKKTQPVFRRYGYLGGPLAPNRITRHE